jgi:hypothetical protein
MKMVEAWLFALVPFVIWIGCVCLLRGWILVRPSDRDYSLKCVKKFRWGLLVVAIISPFVGAFFACGLWMFSGFIEKEANAIQYAESLGAQRWERLYADCQALAHGRPFSVKPYPGGEDSFMWDVKSGYPSEFGDFRPVRAYVSANSVMLMTSKCMDSEVIIEVSSLESGPPLIELTYGNDEHRTKMVMWKSLPIHAPEPTALARLERYPTRTTDASLVR